MKKIVLATAGVALVLLVTACGSGVTKQEYESVSAKVSQLSKEVTDLDKEKSDLKSENASLKSQFESLSDDYNTYKESMADYEGLAAAEAQARQIEAESIAASKAAEEEAAAASKAAEEEAAAAAAAAQKEAEERMGYETGITFDQLARTPDDYKGKKVKFKGKVVQVIEGSGTIQIRLAVNNNYDTVLFGEYQSGIVSSRVLEDDRITIYGTSAGLISYESTMGGNITIPAVSIEKIDQ